MSGYRPPRFGALGAHVSGVSAWVIVSFLERTKAVESFQRLPSPQDRQEVLATYDALRAAGIHWNEQREAAPRALKAPSRQPEPAVPAEPGVVPEGLTTAQAALALGRTDRRVRQLIALGQLAGRRIGGRWQVDAGSVSEFLLGKEVA